MLHELRLSFSQGMLLCSPPGNSSPPPLHSWTSLPRRNQTPPQFMPVWHYRRADTRTPSERTFWRKTEESKHTLNLAVGPKFSVTDTAHPNPSSISSLVIHLHRRTWEVDKAVRVPKQATCSAAHTDMEQRSLDTAFHLCCSRQNRWCEFKHLTLCWIRQQNPKTKSQDVKHLSQMAEYKAQSLEMFLALYSGSWSWSPQDLIRASVSLSLSRWSNVRRMNSSLPEVIL